VYVTRLKKRKQSARSKALQDKKKAMGVPSKSSKKFRASLLETRRTNKSDAISGKDNDGNPRPKGRPRKYNRALMQDEVCNRLSRGELMDGIAKALGISQGDPYKWAWDDPENFGVRFKSARILQAHALGVKAVQAASGKDAASLERRRAIREAKKYYRRKFPNTWRKKIKQLEMGLLARNRLQMDALRWYTSKIAPRDYGDKIDVTSDGSAIVPQRLQVQFVGPDGKPVKPS
jgi:hypothetical protein